MSNLLKSAKVGIVALNWKFEMAKSEDFLKRISAYGFKESRSRLSKLIPTTFYLK